MCVQFIKVGLEEIGHKAWAPPEIFLKGAVRKFGYELTFKPFGFVSTGHSRASRGEECFLEKGF
jgi:hypothetical protein